MSFFAIPKADRINQSQFYEVDIQEAEDVSQKGF